MVSKISRHPFSLFLFILILDIFTKQVVQRFEMTTNTGLIDITYQTNTGSLFSLFANMNAINSIIIFFK